MTDDFRAEELIYFMKKIGLDLAALMDCCLRNDELSGIQVYFLVYLLRHHSEGTYLTELCRETGMSKATLSALIKKLREKDYLYFRERPEDIRKKEVLPTKKLLEESEEFFIRTRQMEDEVCGALWVLYCRIPTCSPALSWITSVTVNWTPPMKNVSRRPDWPTPMDLSGVCRTATILCSPATAPT